MEATSAGPNRTGAALNPKDIQQMLKAVDELSPPVPINTLQMDVERQAYISEAETVGSIPPAPDKAKRSAGKKSKSIEASPAVALLLDKLGERIAFERTGTRLYSALISKHMAVTNSGEDVLEEVVPGESPSDTLQRIRAEELEHFHMLCNVVSELGGDPTVQTPCADVTATASMGLMQVVTDPRTTLAQSLSAMLTAELTDNAGWELLIKLAQDAGQDEMVEPFEEALQDEEQHLVVVRSWLESLLETQAGTPAV
jgi:rubrerythrin